jgi:hypothetical protein
MKDKELYEKVMNKGAQNGDTEVADPVAKNATLPGAGQNKEGMKKIDDPANTPVEDCDSENNTKPTSASAAANKASVGMKEEAEIKEFTIEVAFEGEELSEEFKEKATTIFEAAVSAKVEAATSQLEEQFEAKLEEQVAEVTAKLSEQIDNYLNYVVEKWMEENELAIESSLRTEITEEFIEGMRNLFAENYIEIPEEKLDVLEDLANRVEELSTKLDESINNNIELSKTVKDYAKTSIFAKVAEGLTVTQKEKFSTLAEGVEFADEDSYAKKLQIVKENYFKDNIVISSITESEVDSAEEQPADKPKLSGPVAGYVQAISRSVKK